MNHPCLVTLERDSAPRVLFSGDRLVEVDLPPGTRCIYPKPPAEGLKDPDAAIRYAINHPLGSDPLYAKLRPGMKVTIAIDDISLPLAADEAARRARARAHDRARLARRSRRRRRRDDRRHQRPPAHEADEIRHMVGDKIFDAYYPDRLYNHDAEDKHNMVEIGETRHGEVLELNRRAVESDLVIYVNLNFVPMNGGHKSVAVGLVRLQEPAPAPQPAHDRQLPQLHGPEALEARDATSSAWAGSRTST